MSIEKVDMALALVAEDDGLYVSGPQSDFVDWDAFKRAVVYTLALGRLDTYFEFSQTFLDPGLPDGYC